MEAWTQQLHRRRDLDAAAANVAATAASRTNTIDAYTLRGVDVDKPVKKPQTIEAVLTSRVAWGDVSPLVFMGTSDGTLHCYVPSAGASQVAESAGRGLEPLASLRWHTSYRRLAHACAQFLDSWGVYLTLCDAKLALYTLPLQSNPQVESSASSSLMKGIGIGIGSSSSSDDRMLTVLDETKQTTLFAAHEGARVVCSLSKQHTLRVFDWTVNRTLELRVQHDLPLLLARGGAESATPLSPAALPVQQLLVMGESHVFLQFRREWCVLNIDSGHILDVRAQDASAAQILDTIACVVAVPSRQTALRHPSHQLRDVFVAGKHSAAIIALAVDNEDEEAATVIDEKLRANPQNVSDDRVRVKVERVLEFNVAPRAALYHHPLLLLEHADALAVHNIGTMRLVQRVVSKPLLGAAVVVALDAPQETVGDDNNASAAAAALLTATSPFALQLLTMQRMELLVRHEMTHDRLRDAVALCKLCPEHCSLAEHELRALLAAHALELFESGQHHRAMTLFLESDVDVMDVLMALYPRDLLPRSSGSGSGNGAAGTKGTSLLRPKRRAAELTGEALVQSLLALILLLRHKRDTLVHSSSSNSVVAASDRVWGRTKHSVVSTAQTESRSAKSLEVIDTVLLKCLVLICEKPEHAPSARKELLELVTRPNRCEMGEAEIFLRAHRQLPALLRFYATRKEHRKALELLEDLERTASASAKAAAATTVAPAGPAAATESSAAGDSELQTAEEYMVLTKEYLQRLGRSKAELVFEFSRRVVAVKPALGLAIFTDRRVSEAKEDIDVSLVLNHLKTCELQLQPQPEDSRDGAASDAESLSTGVTTPIAAETSTVALPLIDAQFLAIEYLTQVILAAKTPVASRLHDEVVYLLLDAINTELHSNRGSGGAGLSSGSTTGSHVSRLTGRVSSQRGLVGTLRRKLLVFLKSEIAAYHPERMLSRTPAEMIDERAALLSRLGRHHEVLQLYAIDLKDASLAEGYCNRCYTTKLADSSIYSALLRLYLRPLPSQLAAMSSPSPGKLGASPAPPRLWRSASSHLANSTSPHSAFPSSEAVAAAVSILNKYPERIDVATALELLPTDVPVASLAYFFRRVLECQVERYRNGQVKKQLAKMENFKVRQALSTKRKGSVTVWSSHCCHVCGKKLGTGTFVRLPGGALLHYSCQPAS